MVVLSLFNVDVYRASRRLLDFFNWPALLMFALVVFLIRKFPKVHPIAFIGASAVMGVVFKL